MEEVVENPIKVYVKVNNENKIIDVSSSVFLQDVNGWIEIDSGYGDRYAHAQSLYFNSPLTDIYGNYLINYSTTSEENVENSVYINHQ